MSKQLKTLTNKQFLKLIEAATKGDAQALKELQNIKTITPDAQAKEAAKGKKKEEKIMETKEKLTIGSIKERLAKSKADKEAKKLGFAPVVDALVETNDRGAEMAHTFINGTHKVTELVIDGVSDLAIAAITATNKTAKIVNDSVAGVASAAVDTVHDTIHVGLTGEKVTSERLRNEINQKQKSLEALEKQLAESTKLLQQLMEERATYEEFDDIEITEEEETEECADLSEELIQLTDIEQQASLLAEDEEGNKYYEMPNGEVYVTVDSNTVRFLAHKDDIELV